MKKPCSKPCKQCPWLEDSISGYLGGNSVATYAESVSSDQRIVCHVRFPDKVESEPNEVKEWQVCTGYVLARLNHFKSAKDPVLKHLEDNLRDSSLRGSIFKFPVNLNFTNHHTTST